MRHESVTMPPPHAPSEGGADELPPSSLPDVALHVAGERLVDGPVGGVVDPWTREPIAAIALANAQSAARAAEAAAAAFATTRKMPSHQRKKVLLEITRRIAEAKEEIATLIVRESGKPKTFARQEVERALVTFGLAAEEATRIGGETLPLDITEATAQLEGWYRRVPRGPLLAITPFNFPLNLVAHKVAPALACGVPVVLKPAPQTPLTALRLAEIVRASGAPADMLQVVPCTNDVAETLVRSDLFAMLSFTGSDKVGWHLKSLAGKKRVALELGGNAACIVHDVRDDATPKAKPSLGQVAATLCASAFNYAGQVCIKTQRIYVCSAIAERFIAEFVQRARGYQPADPKSPSTTLGPLIDEKSAIRVDDWIEEAVKAGATPLVRGVRESNRLPATVLRIEGSGAGLKVVEEEAFGPVVTLHVYDRFEEALAWAGGTRYGLQAGIFTDSIARAREAFEALDVGGLIVNESPSSRVDAMPYGGNRDSGTGREGVRFAIEEMTERKMLVSRMW